MAEKQAVAKAEPMQSGGYYVASRRQDILKADAGDASSNALIYEDEFKGSYGVVEMGDDASVRIVEPPLPPKTFEGLVQQNNALSTCIDAMVTNVHETGFSIELKDGSTKEDDPTAKQIRDFLDEVWPGLSFQQLRKQTGQDYEKTGNGYWEVLRNLLGKMVMIRKLDTKVTRMVLMSEAFDVRVSIKRGDEVVTLRVPMRYRRFVQKIGTRTVYYKEYGCPLLIDKTTGKLYPDEPAEKLRLIKEKKLGSEVIHFDKVPDVDTPYGVPAWYPQMPSVLGSRKAEEHNLDYFDAGGVPPIMIFVQGGQLGTTATQALQEFLSSKPGAKQGAPVFEIASTGGSLDGSGANGVKVTVERFGTERQKDSMFEGYDDKCESRIRRAWRLPPIFVGKADDYNLATAQASYAVAEAQVFKPDRDEFDAKMNATIMRELDPSGKYVMRSKGIPVKDVNQQITAIQAAMAQDALAIDHFVDLLNEVTALSMKVRPEAVAEQKAKVQAKIDMASNAAKLAGQPPQAKGQPGQQGKTSGPSGSSKSPPVAGKPKLTVVKDDLDIGAMLAEEAFEAVGRNDGNGMLAVMDQVLKLDPDGLQSFRVGLQEQIFEGAVSSDDMKRHTAAALMMTVFNG